MISQSVDEHLYGDRHESWGWVQILLERMGVCKSVKRYSGKYGGIICITAERTARWNPKVVETYSNENVSTHKNATRYEQLSNWANREVGWYKTRHFGTNRLLQRRQDTTNWISINVKFTHQNLFNEDTTEDWEPTPPRQHHDTTNHVGSESWDPRQTSLRQSREGLQCKSLKRLGIAHTIPPRGICTATGNKFRTQCPILSREGSGFNDTTAVSRTTQNCIPTETVWHSQRLPGNVMSSIGEGAQCANQRVHDNDHSM